MSSHPSLLIIMCRAPEEGTRQVAAEGTETRGVSICPGSHSAEGVELKVPCHLHDSHRELKSGPDALKPRDGTSPSVLNACMHAWMLSFTHFQGGKQEPVLEKSHHQILALKKEKKRKDAIDPIAHRKRGHFAGTGRPLNNDVHTPGAQRLKETASQWLCVGFTSPRGHRGCRRDPLPSTRALH